jgi:hypothetical protein
LFHSARLSCDNEETSMLRACSAKSNWWILSDRISIVWSENQRIEWAVDSKRVSRRCKLLLGYLISGVHRWRFVWFRSEVCPVARLWPWFRSVTSCWFMRGAVCEARERGKRRSEERKTIKRNKKKSWLTVYRQNSLRWMQLCKWGVQCPQPERVSLFALNSWPM